MQWLYCPHISRRVATVWKINRHRHALHQQRIPTCSRSSNSCMSWSTRSLSASTSVSASRHLLYICFILCGLISSFIPQLADTWIPISAYIVSDADRALRTDFLLAKVTWAKRDLVVFTTSGSLLNWLNDTVSISPKVANKSLKKASILSGERVRPTTF